MITVRKFLAPLISPLSICVELMIFGLLLLFFSRKQKTGKVFVALGLVLLLLCSYEGIAGQLLQTLESQYSQLDPAQVTSKEDGGLATRSVKWIVVLAGGLTGDPTLPIQLQISHHSRIRLMEGIRLHRFLPENKIILTGVIGFDGTPEATTLSRVAQELGVAKADMVLEVESRATKDHPFYVRHIVKNEPFILVTSAFHMPRAMKLFVKQGLPQFLLRLSHGSLPRNCGPPRTFFPVPQDSGWPSSRIMNIWESHGPGFEVKSSRLGRQNG